MREVGIAMGRMLAERIRRMSGENDFKWYDPGKCSVEIQRSKRAVAEIVTTYRMPFFT